MPWHNGISASRRFSNWAGTPSKPRSGDERSRSSVAGPHVAQQSTRKRAGTRLAVAGDGATFWLLAGAVGAPLRPQHELGFAAIGASRVVAGIHPAASVRSNAGRATGDEVSGAGGASQRGRRRADGCRFHPLPVRRPAQHVGLPATRVRSRVCSLPSLAVPEFPACAFDLTSRLFLSPAIHLRQGFDEPGRRGRLIPNLRNYLQLG